MADNSAYRREILPACRKIEELFLTNGISAHIADPVFRPLLTQPSTTARL